MTVWDVVTAPFAPVAALRRARVFHPDGLLAGASVERIAPPGVGLPIADSDNVVARISKGIGTAGALPDVIGLAVRLPPQPFAATPWDLLLASAGSGILTRVAGIRPTVKWTATTMSTLMPLQFGESNWWVRARMTDNLSGHGLSIESLRQQMAGGGIHFDLDQARGWGPFAPLARLTLTSQIARAHDVDFDPVLHTADGVRLRPHWLSALRRHAYAHSRSGRHGTRR